MKRRINSHEKLLPRKAKRRLEAHCCTTSMSWLLVALSLHRGSYRVILHPVCIHKHPIKLADWNCVLVLCSTRTTQKYLCFHMFLLSGKRWLEMMIVAKKAWKENRCQEDLWAVCLKANDSWVRNPRSTQRVVKWPPLPSWNALWQLWNKGDLHKNETPWNEEDWVGASIILLYIRAWLDAGYQNATWIIHLKLFSAELV